MKIFNLNYNNDVVRCIFETEATVDKLLQQIQAIFDVLNPSISFIDDDGDTCRISLDAELMEAMRIHPKELLLTISDITCSFKRDEIKSDVVSKIRSKIPSCHFIGDEAIAKIVKANADEGPVGQVLNRCPCLLQVCSWDTVQYSGHFITGVVQNHESIHFSQAIETTGLRAVECVPKIMDAAKRAKRDLLAKASRKFFLKGITSVVSAFPSWISLLMCQVEYTEQVDRALYFEAVFDVVEAETRLKAVQYLIGDRMAQLRSLVLSNLTTAVRANVECTITLTISQLNQLAALLQLLDDQASQSQSLDSSWRWMSNNPAVTVTDSERPTHPVSLLWNRCLRFYVRERGTTVMVECGDVNIEYGFESTGSTCILVQTPLTHRAYYQTLQALDSRNVVQACGPAGTGKTETQKDLWKLLGYKTFVLSCHASMSTQDLDRLVAAKHAWPRAGVVFDEANKLGTAKLVAMISQLTSLAQQQPVGTLPVCVAYNPTQQPIIDPGTFKSGCLIPMTIPDLSHILKVKLAVQGLASYTSQGRNLARLMQWCQENCSKQRYYDFGLRKLAELANRVGNFLREGGHNQDHGSYDFEHETNAIAAAIAFGLFPSMQQADAKLTTEILQATFLPNFKYPCSITDDSMCPNNAKSMIGLLPRLLKCMELRHGTMLCNVNDIEVAIREVSLCGRSLGVKVHVISECDAASLLGAFSTVSQEWQDGQLSATLRECVQQNQPTWFILNGKFTSEQLESFNALLDNNRSLCLESGERLLLPLHSRVLFIQPIGADDTWTSAFVSRLGVVNCEQLQEKHLMSAAPLARAKLPNGTDIEVFCPQVAKQLVNMILSHE